MVTHEVGVTVSVSDSWSQGFEFDAHLCPPFFLDMCITCVVHPCMLRLVEKKKLKEGKNHSKIMYLIP